MFLKSWIFFLPEFEDRNNILSILLPRHRNRSIIDAMSFWMSYSTFQLIDPSLRWYLQWHSRSDPGIQSLQKQILPLRHPFHRLLIAWISKRNSSMDMKLSLVQLIAICQLQKESSFADNEKIESLDLRLSNQYQRSSKDCQFLECFMFLLIF